MKQQKSFSVESIGWTWFAVWKNFSRRLDISGSSL